MTEERSLIGPQADLARAVGEMVRIRLGRDIRVTKVNDPEYFSKVDRTHRRPHTRSIVYEAVPLPFNYQILQGGRVIGNATTDIPVVIKELPKEEAMNTGALFYFKEKYPEMVKVYYVGHLLTDAYSKEFCGGPHVDHTAQIGKFKIVKEEAVGAGLRRIRAVVDS